MEKLIFVNERNESIEFSSASQFHVNMREVIGLSDVRSAIYSINSMGQDGDTFVSSRIESRDIEITGHINERDKELAWALRRKLGRALNPHFAAKLIYQRNDYKVIIGCRAENAPIFSSAPVFQRFTVQLFCANPFWREETDTKEDIAVWRGAFEFPEPGGLEIIDGEWMVGYREPSLIVNCVNRGDVRAGLRAEFRALGAVVNPSLLNVNTGEFIKFNIAMQAGDILSIATGYGEKKVTLRRGGIVSDAFRFVDVDSAYLQLAVGDNLFRYDAQDNLANLEVAIYHNNYYLGV